MKNRAVHRFDGVFITAEERRVHTRLHQCARTPPRVLLHRAVTDVDAQPTTCAEFAHLGMNRQRRGNMTALHEQRQRAAIDRKRHARHRMHRFELAGKHQRIPCRKHEITRWHRACVAQSVEEGLDAEAVAREPEHALRAIKYRAGEHSREAMQ